MTDELRRLEGVLRDRQAKRPAGSYTVTLLDDRDLMLRKIMEEAFEVCLELGRDTPDRPRTAEEAADLIYHLMVGLTAAGVSLDEVIEVLQSRHPGGPK